MQVEGKSEVFEMPLSVKWVEYFIPENDLVSVYDLQGSFSTEYLKDLYPNIEKFILGEIDLSGHLEKTATEEKLRGHLTVDTKKTQIQLYPLGATKQVGQDLILQAFVTQPNSNDFKIDFEMNGVVDEKSEAWDGKQDKIDDNTWEITAGVEYDICKLITLSGGWQTTNYGLSDAYMNDLSFTTNSNSWGAGARINITEKWNIDLGFMQTLYKDREVKVKTAAGDKIDIYSRTNRVLGIGLNFSF